MQAIITLEYSNPRIASAVAKAVSPDNFKVPAGLKVRTEQTNNRVITDISLDGKIVTFIATIDDLLESVSMAEKALNVVKRKRL